MRAVEERIKALLPVLKGRIVKRVIPIELLYSDCGYSMGAPLPRPETMRRYDPYKDRLDGSDKHNWFYAKADVPAEGGGERVVLLSEPGGAWQGHSPQHLVYIDGEIYGTLDANHHELRFSGAGVHEIHIYAYCGYERASSRTFTVSVAVMDELAEKLYFDLLAPFQVAQTLELESAEYRDLLYALNDACKLVDFREGIDENSYNKSLCAAIAYLDKNLYGAALVDKPPVVSCIGHTHIDVAWLWPLRQTREKAVRSFATVIYLMERYPDYRFTSSQPALYQMVKEDAPALYEKIKARVREGRWEAEGAMWLEADCNLPSGESLVRQILHGKRFFKEEFGVDSRVLWLPDVFGYSAALPQIVKKSGIDAFVTSKISWNEVNKMPYDIFSWKGIDGSEVFTYFLTAQNAERGKEPSRFTTYVGSADAQQVIGTWARLQQKELSDSAMLTYGYGDGGGGPTREMLEQLRRTKRGIRRCPVTKNESVRDFIDRVRRIAYGGGRLPVWSGELYLEYHRGTYTAMARNKLFNRRCEFLYRNLEALAVSDAFLTGGGYPARLLEDGWKTILLNQFHDIIPGSSIKEVYDDSFKQYDGIMRAAENETDRLHRKIADAADSGIIVFNPNPFSLTSDVRFDGGFITAENIPANGFKVIKEIPAPKKRKISERGLENSFFKLRLDKACKLVSVYDKRAKRELLKEGGLGNAFEAYEDYPSRYDAWNLDEGHKEKKWIIDGVSSVATVESGSRYGLKTTRKFLGSTITQTIWLSDSVQRIDFETHVDWHSPHICLKTAFDFDINTDFATCDIQFGTVRRSTSRNTSWDAARFEVCAHKFVDVSEDDYGVSLLNDCKYGHDLSGSSVRLTLLRCTSYPNPDADKGEHTFTYSLYPHTGAYSCGDVYRYAYDLNNPMRAYKSGGGARFSSFSAVSADVSSVVIDTIKRAEDGDGIIVRMFQCGNINRSARISFGFDISKAFLCDLMENNLSGLNAENNAVNIHFKPFEIITIKVFN